MLPRTLLIQCKHIDELLFGGFVSIALFLFVFHQTQGEAWNEAAVVVCHHIFP